MSIRHGVKRLTIVEGLVIFCALAILAWILFPLFAPRHGGKSSAALCLSQVRQISVAIQMYCQDNKGRYPGDPWTTGVYSYLGGAYKVFFCPSDVANDTVQVCSYAYNGILLAPDHSGINEAQVSSPVDVGVMCDASPSRALGTDSYYPIAPLMDPAEHGATPAARHSKGIVMGFADGHAKYIPEVGNEKEMTSLVTKGFLMASALGWVDNPAGGMADFPLTEKSTDTLTLGGEPCTQVLLRAAAAAWKQKTGGKIAHSPFKGQYADANRTASYLWGVADGERPAGNAVELARDEVVVIVSRNTHLTQPYISTRNPSTPNEFPCIDSAQLGQMLHEGRNAKWQAYTYDELSGTRRFFTRVLTVNGQPLAIGKQANVVADDLQMVDAVANDPVGIGYCSSAAVDFDRVSILALRQANGETHWFQPTDPKQRTIRPDAPSGPLARTLYAVYGGKAEMMVKHMLAPGGEGTQSLHAGPLFKASYW